MINVIDKKYYQLKYKIFYNKKKKKSSVRYISFLIYLVTQIFHNFFTTTYVISFDCYTIKMVGPCERYYINHN